MPDIVHWSTFFTATIILLLIPGPSVMYVVTRGIEHGYRGVGLSSVGLALGDLLQVLCTVAGLAALLGGQEVTRELLSGRSTRHGSGSYTSRYGVR
jgi:threonine/homoserine/homoserine lactone efflux protein